MTLCVSHSDTVGAVKAVIAQRYGIPVAELRLVCANQDLCDHRTLASYKLSPHATLSVETRVRGGGGLKAARKKPKTCQGTPSVANFFTRTATAVLPSETPAAGDAGVDNRCNDCFAIAVLQCLKRLRALTDALHEHAPSSTLATMLTSMRTAKTSFITLDDLPASMHTMAAYDDDTQQDAHEYLRAVLDQTFPAATEGPFKDKIKSTVHLMLRSTPSHGPRVPC